MKWRLLPVLAATLLLLVLTAVPAIADGPVYSMEVTTQDATCQDLFGRVRIWLFIDGEPAGAGVPITFTWHDFPFDFSTNDDGAIFTMWAYTPGEGEVTVGISAGSWGGTEAVFNGPDVCEGIPIVSVAFQPSCDGETIDFSASWEGADLDLLQVYLDTDFIWWEGAQFQEFENPASPVSHTFATEPGTTYYYLVFWFWGGDESNSFTEGFVTAEECPPPTPGLNRYHPFVIHSILGPEGVDKVGVWGYYEGHWGDQYEFAEVTHEGGHVAWVGMPDGDYKAVYRWCENGEVREYWDHFSFGGATDIVSPTINLAEVEYTVVGPCGEPDPDP